MKMKVAAALALSLLVNASTANAQSAGFSVGGGIDTPVGDFNKNAKLGFHGLAAVSFMPEGAPVGLQLDGSYSQFSDDTPDDVKFQLIYATGNVVYNFRNSEENQVRPYLIGGAGIYNFKQKGDAIPAGFETSQTKFGINAGAGFNFMTGSARLFIEGRFHDVFVNGENLLFIPITFGIRFGGH